MQYMIGYFAYYFVLDVAKFSRVLDKGFVTTCELVVDYKCIRQR